MATPISSLRNLGPAMEAAFARAGIASAEALRALGTDAAYAKLLAAGERPHFIPFYVIEMALQGRPWNDATPAEKAALRSRFDAIKSEAAAQTAPAADGTPPALAAALDEIGVRVRGA